MINSVTLSLKHVFSLFGVTLVSFRPIVVFFNVFKPTYRLCEQIVDCSRFSLKFISYRYGSNKSTNSLLVDLLVTKVT